MADLLAQVQQISRDFLTVPQPSLVVQPNGGAITGLLTIVHGADPGVWQKDFFGIPGFTVHVRATPARYDWSFSDGDGFMTGDPGRAYDGTRSTSAGPYPSGYYVGTVFGQAGSGSASLTVGWDVSAEITGLPVQALAPLSVGPQQVGFQVRSAHSELVHG